MNAVGRHHRKRRGESASLIRHSSSVNPQSRARAGERARFQPAAAEYTRYGCIATHIRDNATDSNSAIFLLQGRAKEN